MTTFDIPLILVSSFVGALFFGFFSNLIGPKYLRDKLFSKEWWHFVFFMTGIILFVYVLNYLFGSGEKQISWINKEGSIQLGWLITFGFILFALTFYLKEKRIKTILYWLAGLGILLPNLYYLFFFKIFTYQVILGLFTGIYVLAYGPTGKLDKMIEKIKEKKRKITGDKK
ncbi:hypothetical protein KKB43_04425 [Patescibacteria group bacterium]|nr:hypothetical protein [Patescibacteria group bacterium]MBU4580233.1 hypothetical protein [Patescibacteria group bacterium]